MESRSVGQEARVSHVNIILLTQVLLEHNYKCSFVIWQGTEASEKFGKIINLQPGAEFSI